jgi:hypothetical protein
MGLEVYINGELIELQPNINIGLTYQVGSILNLSGRSGNLSNKFTVPKTQNNTRILGTILNINAGTNIPYQRNSGKIVQNGLELFPDGLAIVESSGSSYSLTIYSGNVSFFDLIKGRNINELDWSDSNHVYDIPTIIDSFTNNSDYIYPIVDFGDSVELLDNSNLQNSNSLLPCVRISSVLEKIFTSVGYELKGSFRNIDQYSRLILTPNRFGYLESDINANSGTATDVVLQNDELTIESNIVNPTPFAEIITLDYQTITWEKYLAGKYVPDNNYFGSFELSVQGNLENFIPIAGENGIDSDSLSQNAVWQNGNINDTHACYTSNKNLVNDLIVHEFKTGLNTVITSINGTVSWGVGMTETEGGYIAYSD